MCMRDMLGFGHLRYDKGYDLYRTCPASDTSMSRTLQRSEVTYLTLRSGMVQQ
jgi:hypothetical protein